MSDLPIYEKLTPAFAGEGVDTLFSLMGDGNMHWATAMSKLDGMRVFHARHEHCVCGMAMGYYNHRMLRCGAGHSMVRKSRIPHISQALDGQGLFLCKNGVQKSGVFFNPFCDIIIQ